MMNNKEENLEINIIEEEHFESNEWIDLRRLTCLMPDGTVFTPFYSYSCKSYVVIVPSDEEGNYLTVRQYRLGIREITNEFPAGGIEHCVKPGTNSTVIAEHELDQIKAVGNGDKNSIFAPGEAFIAAAKRELMEETGYASDEWTHLMTVPSNATRADNYAVIFRAKNCRKIASLRLDDTEFLHVQVRTEREMEELISRGQFQQAIHILAWELSKNR